MKNIIKSLLVLFIAISPISQVYSQKNENCLYKNPLCFYNTDILNYLQILHKNQQYDKMINFMYGPAID